MSKPFPWAKTEGAYYAVIILCENFDLTNEERLQVFRHVIEPEAKKIEPGCAMKLYNFTDGYSGRRLPARKAWNRAIDLDNPSPEEKGARENERATTLRKLRKGMRELGLWAAEVDKSWSGEEDDVDAGGLDQVDGLEDGLEGAQPRLNGESIVRPATEDAAGLGIIVPASSRTKTAGKSMSDNGDVRASNSTVENGGASSYLGTGNSTFGSQSMDMNKMPDTVTSAEAQKATNQDDTPTGPKLNMVHYRDCTWQADMPHCRTASYIDHGEDMYKLGGKVYRVTINGKLEDAMICNMAACQYCIYGSVNNTPGVSTVGLRSPGAFEAIRGLPSAHANDITTPHRGAGRIFAGTARGWTPECPSKDNMYQNKVTFTGANGEVLEKVETMTCMHKYCKQCNPPMTEEEELALYRPGGKEYEEMKAEEEKWDQMRRERLRAEEEADRLWEEQERAEKEAAGKASSASKRKQG